jgi:outer membrane phospholipase A
MGRDAILGLLLSISVLVLAAPPPALAGAPTLAFTCPQTSAAADGCRIVTLNVLNDSASAVAWTFPPFIPCRITSASAALPDLALEKPTPEVLIEPGSFARANYRVKLPERLGERLILEFPGTPAAPLVLETPETQSGPLAAAAVPKENVSRLGDGKPALSAERREELEPSSEGPAPYDPGRLFRRYISGYEPFYFIAGPDSPNAKFQISFKYQLITEYGALGQKAPWTTGFHLAYTQTSLWDWNRPSAPFLDSSYKPELLYLRERVLGGEKSDFLRLDLQTGFQHESNGKDGLDSRSLNIAYLRPTLFMGPEDGFQVSLMAKPWVYVGDLSDNPDIARYRGYADLRLTAGWRRSLQLSATGRVGNRGDRGSLQLDLSYPLLRITGESLTLYAFAQYFTGYGESLLQYDQRTSAFRAGIALYR